MQELDKARLALQNNDARELAKLIGSTYGQVRNMKMASYDLSKVAWIKIEMLAELNDKQEKDRPNG